MGERPRVPPSSALLLLSLAGCSASGVTIADAFPKGAYASPWVLQEAVWEGTFAQAAGGLGAEAEQWSEYEPGRVWLALYRHETRAEHKLTARAWAFSSAERARRAFERFRPIDADALKAGDEACWTSDGVLVLWGRMVFDIFGSGPTSLAGPEQALYLLALIEKRMPAGLPDAPR